MIASIHHKLAAALVVAALVLGGTLFGVFAPSSTGPAAADGGFAAGNIVSDATFYNSGTLSADGVQSFLERRAPNCVSGSDGTPCLQDFRQATATRSADSRCRNQYTGSDDESAAEIIAKVSKACGINPQVILVMLQKEQGLVTDSGRSLYASRYRSALGYGCPDTALCDTKYYGFFNQVYSAASQFKNYANNPSSYSHRAGFVNNVRFSPNAACGSSAVYIQNQATASLYNYTPYQPNAAALAAGFGLGDSCSAYGNRNFWNYFSAWFGPSANTAPVQAAIGFLDSVTTTPTSITATGWALDQTTTAPIAVHVYVDGASQPFVADDPRPDVGAAYGKGDQHGFSATVPAETGPHNVCVWAITAGTGNGNTSLGCRTVVVASPATGFVDTVTVTSTSITAKGWALSPDSNDPISVHMYVDGESKAFTADQSRPDVATAFGKGDRHGYTATMSATPGPHNVCVWAIAPAGNGNTGLGCRTVVVPSPPTGFVDTVTTTTTSITAKGWALDPDTTEPIPVHLYVDGASKAFTADQSRPDVAAAFGKGDRHGYTATLPAAAGPHNVCVWGIDTTGAAANTNLGCRSVTVKNRSPVGFFDAVTATPGGVTATGWAFDPDSNEPIAVHLYVDGVSAAFTANQSRPDVAAAFGQSDLRGFTATMPAGPGKHSVCAYAIDATNTAPNASLGCRTITTS